MNWKQTSLTTLRRTWKVARPLLLLAAIWFGGKWAGEKTPGLFLVHIQPWQSAVRQGNFSGGLEEVDLAPGLHVSLPGVDSIHFVDMRGRMTGFGVPFAPDTLGAIDLRTSDDNAVAVSAVVLWRVREGEAHSIVKEALVETLATRVALTASKVLRREFALLGSEAWFDAPGRVALTREVEPKLAEELAVFNVELEGIKIHGISFSDDYEVKLQEKQINHQKGLLFDAVSRVEEANAEVAKLESETKVKEQQLLAEWEQAKVSRRITADMEKAKIKAETNTYVQNSQAEADVVFERAVTAGQLTWSLAVEGGKRLRLEALTSEGGRIWLAREAAKQLKVDQVWLDSRDPNVPSMLDLDEMTKLLLGEG